MRQPSTAAATAAGVTQVALDDLDVEPLQVGGVAPGLDQGHDPCAPVEHLAYDGGAHESGARP